MKRKNSKKTIFVGISGGVDSALSLYLLKKEGYNTVGVFIKTWHPHFLECNEEAEMQDAMRICAFLDVPFLTFDFQKEYKKNVADYMISEYKKGRTPNPDVMCNKEIKFKAFLEKAISMGADYIATGHYARINYLETKNSKNFSAFALGDDKTGNPRRLKFSNFLSEIETKNSKNFSTFFYSLEKAKDKSKDQVYFLWTLKQEQLSKIIFPIGHLNKSEVRKLAKKYSLPVSEKKDSQGICFLGKVDIKDFLKHYIKEKKGKVLDKKGQIVGQHNGINFFTIGQRHGFLINKKSPNDKPYYIIDKDLKKNILYVSIDKNDIINNKENNIITIYNTNWINELPSINKNYEAQIRYRGEFLDCKIQKLNKNKATLIFKENIKVANGQSIVLYNKDMVLGGGIVI